MNMTSFLILFLLQGLFVVGLMLFNTGSLRSKNAATQMIKHVLAIAMPFILLPLLASRYAALTQTGTTPTLWWLPPSILFLHHARLNVTGDALWWALSMQWFVPIIGLCCIASASAGRLKLWAYWVFAPIWLLLIYPPIVQWSSAHSSLNVIGAMHIPLIGAMLIAGPCAALTGSTILGTRYGRHHRAFNLNWVCLGGIFMLLGSLGFSGSIAHSVCVLAGASLSFMLLLMLTRIVYGWLDITFSINGMMAAIACMVAYAKLTVLPEALLLCAISAVFAWIIMLALRKSHVDDPSGTSISFLVGAIVGSLHTALLTQALGVGLIMLWSVIASAVIWFILHLILGLRIDHIKEARGQDLSEIGVTALPEFQHSGR